MYEATSICGLELQLQLQLQLAAAEGGGKVNNIYVYVCMYVCMYVYIYINIYRMLDACSLTYTFFSPSNGLIH